MLFRSSTVIPPAAPVTELPETATVRFVDVEFCYPGAAEPVLTNIVFIDGEKMKTLAEAYFELLFEFDPKTVGGKLPAEDFYYLPAAK